MIYVKFSLDNSLYMSHQVISHKIKLPVSEALQYFAVITNVFVPSLVRDALRYHGSLDTVMEDEITDSIKTGILN